MIIEGKVCCKLYGELEVTLSKLNNLKDCKIALLIEYFNIQRSYRENKISSSEFEIKAKDILSDMKQIEKMIEEYSIRKNKAVETRDKNSNNRNKDYFNRKIDGININTFRLLTKELYSDKLPNECIKCSSKDKLHIHHLRYKYPIELKDLVRICASCHSRLHKRKITLPPTQHMENLND